MGKYGPEADKLIYNFEDRGGRQVGLRYDLTVPLARVIASHGNLPRPFKRYQIGPVWRAEQPQKGRYREFVQCDVDIVGAAPPVADAEMVAVLYTAYRELGINDVTIRLNHRRALAAMARLSGIRDELRAAAFRSMDKLDKLPEEAVMDEMLAAGILAEAARRLLDFTRLCFSSHDSLALEQAFASDGEGLAACREMGEIVRMVEAMGVPQGNFRFDLSLVRGLDYYTGTIVEAVAPQLRGSIGGGGRYDGLVGMFGSQSVPTVGCSLGLDRIIDVLAGRGVTLDTKTVTDVLVTVFDASLRTESLALATELRDSGLKVETFLMDRALGKQLAYADTKGIPYAVVIGPDENQAGEVILKNLRSRAQQTLPRAELSGRLKTLITEA